MTHQTNLNDLATFVAVVRHQSFTRAAAKLGVSQSAISQTITQLETQLQLKLLNRTTRSLTLTEAGTRLLHLVEPALEDIQLGLETLANLRTTPSGTIRISADEYAIDQVLWPRLAPLLRQYPDIKIELIADYGRVDIAKERYDAGVRRGGLIAKNMIGIPISAPTTMTVVAAHAFFKQHAPPQIPAALSSLPCINLQLPNHGEDFLWVFNVDGQEQKLKVNGQLVFNNLKQIIQAAIDGFGCAYVPQALVQTELKKSQLVSVLPDYCITYPSYYLYYTSRLQSSVAFTLVKDALKV